MTTADDLRAAADRLEAVREQAAELPGDVERVADAYRSVTRVMEQYEERATDWDDFEGYVRFRETFGRTLADVPEDLPAYEAFETADDHLTSPASRPLSDDDFAAAREALAPVERYHEVAEERAAARDAYRSARRATRDARSDLEQRVEHLERLLELGEADLDAPVERLREPIDRYNEAVSEAFRTFRAEVSARELLAFVERSRSYPLAAFEAPPERLADFVAGSPAGEEPVGTLLEYADYSRSKLDHYVDNPQALKSAVATNRTYLDRLDAGPLTVDWPPPPADELAYRVRELVAVAGRLSDEPVPTLRELRTLTDDDDYERLREAAVARAELDETERERIASGAADADLADARERLVDVRETLAAHPPLD